jgi:hypothetical protein
MNEVRILQTTVASSSDDKASQSPYLPGSIHCIPLSLIRVLASPLGKIVKIAGSKYYTIGEITMGYKFSLSSYTCIIYGLLYRSFE